jgi:hypothetical protein
MIKIEEKKESLKRMSICLKCEHLIPLLKVCKICKCVMPLKVKLKEASCPKNKW